MLVLQLKMADAEDGQGTRYERFKAWYERNRLGKGNQQKLLNLIEQEYSFLFDSHKAKIARGSIFEPPRKQLKQQADDYPSFHDWRVPKVMVTIRFIDEYIDSLKNIDLRGRTCYPVLYVMDVSEQFRFCKPGNKPGGETQDEPVLYFRVWVPRNAVPPNFMPTGILDHDEATVQYLDKLQKDLQSLRYGPVGSEYCWKLRADEREEQSAPCKLVEELIYALNFWAHDADSKDFIMSLFNAVGALVTKSDSILYNRQEEMFKASSNFSQSLPNFCQFWGRAFHMLAVDFNPRTEEFSCPFKLRSRLPDAVLFLRSHGIAFMAVISECKVYDLNPIQESLEEMLEFSSFILADQEVVYFVVFSVSSISLSAIYRDMTSHEIKITIAHEFQVMPFLHVEVERAFPTDDFMMFFNLLLDATYKCISRV